MDANEIKSQAREIRRLTLAACQEARANGLAVRDLPSGAWLRVERRTRPNRYVVTVARSGYLLMPRIAWTSGEMAAQGVFIALGINENESCS